MAKITLTQLDIEEMVEKALENACLCRAIGKYKLMYEYRGEANACLDLLESMGIYYDDVIINEYVQKMVDTLGMEDYRLMVVEI